MFGQPTIYRPAASPARRRLPRLLPKPVLRPRGVGQTPPGVPNVSLLPTCASVDAAQTIPQMALTAGGSLAMLIGIAGAIFADPAYRQDFAIAAGVGVLASAAGGIWAMNSFSQDVVNGPQCTGPGLPSLGMASVNPDQTTPPGALANPVNYQALAAQYAPATSAPVIATQPAPAPAISVAPEA